MFSYVKTLSQYKPSNIVIWMSLAFQAGAMNAGAFLSCQRFVSHVTGFSTLAGTDAAQGKWSHGLIALFIPGFFIGGSMLSAYLVDRRIQAGQKPLYPIVMFCILALTVAVTFAGVRGFFGEFGAPFVKQDYWLVAALCLACGLQNGTVTSAMGATVRTTHLTGVTTDLGIGLVRILTRSHHIQSRQNEIRANWMRTGVIASFTLGSLISSILYLQLAYWGFLIPSVIAIILFFWSLLHFNNDRAGNTT